MPHHFAEAGYTTTSVHAFTDYLFERATWYPQIGFQQMVFRKDLVAKGARDCPGIFPGACDVDVAPMIHDRLVQARSPQFVYWLTLNSHLPVVADDALGTTKCTRGTAQWRDDFASICRMFELHHKAADSISKVPWIYLRAKN